MNQKKSDGKKRPSASFVTGAIALAFLITGYQTALFMHRAAALKVVSDMTSPDTVFVYADEDVFSGDKSESVRQEFRASPSGMFGRWFSE